MRQRAQAMLEIDVLMSGLTELDRMLVASEVWRTYGNTNGKHVEKTRGSTPEHVEKTPDNTSAQHVFSGVGGGYRGGSSVRRRDPVLDKTARELLEFLNLKAGKSYRPVEENLRFIRARLNTCSVEDIKGVIARKTREWLNTDMAKYLRPATLFNATKFEAYLGERPNA